MKISLNFILFLLLLISTHLASCNKPFKSIKARKETIENYEVIKPEIYVYQEEDNVVYPSYIQINISTSVGNFSFDFYLNEDIMSSSFTSVVVDGHDNTVLDKHKYSNCYYTGQVRENSNWTAHMSARHGLQAEFGNKTDAEQYYHLEPLSKENSSIYQLHAFYKQSEYKLELGDFKCEIVNNYTMSREFINTTHSSHERVRRQSLIYYVEFVAVNDYAQFLAYGASVQTAVERTLDIANGMNNLYINNLDIRIVLMKVITFSSGRVFNTSQSVALINIFASYGVDQNELIGPRDNMMLFTGLDLVGSTIGIAFVGTMCFLPFSVGVTQDGGFALNMVVTIATHEVGHNFNMRHDYAFRNCSCPDEFCIMFPSIRNPPQTRFSSCSFSDLDEIRDQLSCLLNVPSVMLAESRCGDGIVQGNETCDCGEPGVCTSSCCNATTCQLVGGAQCAKGTCCNTSTCQLLEAGSVCRDQIGECDITETCDGNSSDCPADFFMMNGISCASNTGYCYNGQCPTHQDQCLFAWGVIEGSGVCYNLNTLGTEVGNCGHNSSAYLPCSENNILCGQLQCQGGSYQNVYRLNGIVISNTIQGENCSSFSVNPTRLFSNPGLVLDGTRCGTDMVCMNQECRNVSSFNFPSCPVGENGLICSGSSNGVCSHLGICFCFDGFSGNSCEPDPTGNGSCDLSF